MRVGSAVAIGVVTVARVGSGTRVGGELVGTGATVGTGVCDGSAIAVGDATVRRLGSRAAVGTGLAVGVAEGVGAVSEHAESTVATLATSTRITPDGTVSESSLRAMQALKRSSCHLAVTVLRKPVRMWELSQ